jgi:biotin carboxyl carrier protein
MRYYVTVGKRTFEVVLHDQDVIVDGSPVQAELRHVAGTLLRHLTLNHESHRVVALPGEARGHWDLQLDGERVRLEVVDERTRAIRAMTARTAVVSGPKPVRAPMPGMVVRVEVEVGAQVRAGQGVVIIEAMKMENELKADGAGVVTRIMAEPGTAVEKGAVLVEFAAEPHG